MSLPPVPINDVVPGKLSSWYIVTEGSRSRQFMVETGEEEEDHGGNLVNVVDSGAMRWLLV